METAIRELEEEAGVVVTKSHLEPVLLYESTAEVLDEGIEKAKNHILVMFYAAHVSDKQRHTIEVKVQETEVQSHAWVHEDHLFDLLEHSQSEDDLIGLYGEMHYQNYSKIYPNAFERGLPEGHVLAFMSYYKNKKGLQ